jgi:hypothetical protein
MKIVTANPRVQQSAGSKISKPSYCNVATPTQCALCNDSQKLFKCEKFLKLQPRQRHNHVKQQGLCLIACNRLLRIIHVQSKCRVCHKRHHTLLHIDKQNQVANTNKSTTSNSSPAPTNVLTGAQVNTYHTFKSKSRNHVLLATAIVEVRNKTGQYIPCRALLGSSSHTL